MKDDKKRKLEEAGWRIGSAADFLGLSPQEAAYFELRVNLSKELRAQRERRGWTQSRLARQIGSSQSRIAKAESNDPSVSVDLIIRALFAAGVSNLELCKAIGDATPAA